MISNDIKGQRVGYRRVSAVDQKLDRQDLGECDVVFEEKVSGKDRSRPQLEAMMKHVRKGDEVVIWSIDRLARNLSDLQQIINELVAKGVRVRFLTENLEFGGDSDPFKTLQLQMMGAFAEFERAIIRKRQLEGIAAAKARGAYRKNGVQIDIQEAQKLLSEGKSLREVASIIGTSKSSLWRAVSC